MAKNSQNSFHHAGSIGRTSVSVAIAVIVLAALFANCEIQRRSNRQSLSIADLDPLLREISERYRVDLVLGDHRYPVTTYHGLIQATNASETESKRYCAILADEFLLYPKTFVRRSRLKRIVLCRGLSYRGQNRAAVPDFEHGTLYLDVVAGDYSPAYQRSTIHHDFFHMIDYQDDGELDSDAHWARLNPPEFEYGSGGDLMQDDSLSGVLWDRPGFLNR